MRHHSPDVLQRAGAKSLLDGGLEFREALGHLVRGGEFRPDHTQTRHHPGDKGPLQELGRVREGRVGHEQLTSMGSILPFNRVMDPSDRSMPRQKSISVVHEALEMEKVFSTACWKWQPTYFPLWEYFRVRLFGCCRT